MEIVRERWRDWMEGPLVCVLELPRGQGRPTLWCCGSAASFSTTPQPAPPLTASACQTLRNIHFITRILRGKSDCYFILWSAGMPIHKPFFQPDLLFAAQNISWSVNFKGWWGWHLDHIFNHNLSMTVGFVEKDSILDGQS